MEEVWVYLEIERRNFVAAAKYYGWTIQGNSHLLKSFWKDVTGWDGSGETWCHSLKQTQNKEI